MMVFDDSDTGEKPLRAELRTLNFKPRMTSKNFLRTLARMFPVRDSRAAVAKSENKNSKWRNDIVLSI